MAHHFRHRQQKERNLRARSSSAFIPDPSDRTEDIAAPDRPRRKIHGNHPLAAGCLSWEEALQNYSENELFWAELSNNSVNQSRDQAPSSEPPRNPRKASPSQNAHFRSQKPNVSEVDSVIGDASKIDNDGDIHMSEDQGVQQIPNDNIGIAKQHRAPTVPMLGPNIIRGVHPPERARNHRVEQARRPHYDQRRQRDNDWLDQQVNDFFAELLDHDIQSTQESMLLGRLAFKWMAQKLGRMS